MKTSAECCILQPQSPSTPPLPVYYSPKASIPFMKLTMPNTSIIAETKKASKKRKTAAAVAGNNGTFTKKLRTASKTSIPTLSGCLFAGEKGKLSERKTRFSGSSKKKPDPLYKPLSAPRKSSDVKETKTKTTAGPLVGENTNLEKPYLRLTTFPRKEDVRPLDVLVKSLSHIKGKYIRDEDFDYANEQLKSVRQDLTVQGIRNRFCLNVYETHARILLEHGDLNEFNQCQTMIRSLTEGGKVSSSSSDEDEDENVVVGSNWSAQNEHEATTAILRQSVEAEDEFRGYAILYALVRNSWTELKTELQRTRAALAATVAKHHGGRESSARHALAVVHAVQENDYRTFFRMYESAPHMSAYIMDFLVKRVRDGAYKRIMYAYRPSVSVEHVRECLCFHDLPETRAFLRQSGAVFVEEQGEPSPFWVDCIQTKAKNRKQDENGSNQVPRLSK